MKIVSSGALRRPTVTALSNGSLWERSSAQSVSVEDREGRRKP